MKISEIIRKLEGAKGQFGDVEIFIENGDGYSTWMSSFNPTIIYKQRWPRRDYAYVISHDGY